MWLGAAIEMAQALGAVDASNACAASHGQAADNSIDRYLQCFRCGSTSADFVPAQPGDCPMGVTIQAVVVPEGPAVSHGGA